MRTPEEILKIILEEADRDPRILAVGLQGSRSHDLYVDTFSDFDVVYIVDQIQPFLADPTWIDRFGDRRILQTPDDFYNTNFDAKTVSKFAWLMQFTDRSRIDLTLIERESKEFNNLKMKVILDKTGEITSRIPTLEIYANPAFNPAEFRDTVNEFWWLTYVVAKGIARCEAFYAKSHFELLLEMLIKMVRMSVVQAKYDAQIGKYDRHLHRYLDPLRYQNVLDCYPSCEIQDMAIKLILIMKCFNEIASELADLRSMKIQEDTDMIQDEIKSILKETGNLEL